MPVNEPSISTPSLGQKLPNFPKLSCPFVRVTLPVSRESFKTHKAKYNLRTPDVYLATREVTPDYEWVFDDPDTIAVEKLNGTNISLFTENGRLLSVYNRDNPVDALALNKGRTHIMEGIWNAAVLGHVKDDGLFYGELIGPKFNSNPHNLAKHLWYPFEKTISSLCYQSLHKKPVTYDNLSSWFEYHLHSLFYAKHHKVPFTPQCPMAEGVIFYNLKRKAAGLSWQAKLRRDMFRWYYEPEIEILGI